MAELERIDLLIRVQVWLARQRQASDPQFQGLYISEQELETLLQQPVGLPSWANTPSPLTTVDVQAALEQIRDRIAKCTQASIAKGIKLRLYQLAEDFQLTPEDLDILLICLAPELDLRYERLYAYLQDDITKKRPSVDLTLNLLSSDFNMKLEMRSRFATVAPLQKNQLLQLWADPSQPQPTLLSQYLKVEARIVNYLLGHNEIDSRLITYCQITRCEALSLEDLLLPAEFKQHFHNLIQQPDLISQNLIFYFQGAYGVGKSSTAQAICQALGLGLLMVKVKALLDLEVTDFKATIGLIFREAILQEALIYWQDFEYLINTERKDCFDYFMARIESDSRLNFFAGESDWEPISLLKNKTFLRLKFPLPTVNEREKLWQRGLKNQLNTPTQKELTQLASKFRFSGGQISDAIAKANELAYWRNPQQIQITTTDLYEACRLQSNSNLAKLARKIIPRRRWEDLILPLDQLQQLREICNFVKYRALVYEQWGFESKLVLGKGLYSLFSGPPGTGKTMTAEIMAEELGLDLYKIDLSTVVSKYIGETEKNLSRIFQEAETSNAILFFDEADALFGKRSQISDAHDRYANIEVSYLLQKLEEYEGIVILATNFRRNLDDAFLRRFHFTVEFALPKEKERLRIWQGILPAATPQSSDLDLGFMARQFEISGGNIRNIALAAAFLAADDGEVVTMTHLLRATRREYQKMGKVLMGKEFGEYARLL